MIPLPKPGEIWATRTDVWLPSLNARVSAGDSDIVLVIVGPAGSRSPEIPDVRVAPMSTRVDMAADEDVLLTPGETGLRRAWIVETWNSRPALVRNLQKCIARIDEVALRRVLEVHDSRYRGESSPHAAGTSIEADADPRFKFQTNEAIRAEYLSEPVFDLLGLPVSSDQTELQAATHLAFYYPMLEEYEGLSAHAVYIHSAFPGDPFAAFRNPSSDAAVLALTALHDIVSLKHVFESHRAIACSAVIHVDAPAITYTVNSVPKITAPVNRLGVSPAQLT